MFPSFISHLFYWIYDLNSATIDYKIKLIFLSYMNKFKQKNIFFSMFILFLLKLKRFKILKRAGKKTKKKIDRETKNIISIVSLNYEDLGQIKILNWCNLTVIEYICRAINNLTPQKRKSFNQTKWVFPILKKSICVNTVNNNTSTGK